MTVGATQGRPVIGLSTYREQAAWSVWNMSADLLPSVYTRSVEAAGGVVVLLPPQVEGMARGGLQARWADHHGRRRRGSGALWPDAPSHDQGAP